MVPNLEFRKQGQWVGRTKPRGEASLSKDFLIQSMSSQSRIVPEVSVGVLLTYWQFKERVENLVIEILSLFFSNLNIKDGFSPNRPGLFHLLLQIFCILDYILLSNLCFVNNLFFLPFKV